MDPDRWEQLYDEAKDDERLTACVLTLAMEFGAVIVGLLLREAFAVLH